MQFSFFGVACVLGRRANVRMVLAGAFAAGRRMRRLAGREVLVHV